MYGIISRFARDVKLPPLPEPDSLLAQETFPLSQEPCQIFISQAFVVFLAQFLIETFLLRYVKSFSEVLVLARQVYSWFDPLHVDL